MGLRLAEGVDIARMAARFGLSSDDLCDPAKLSFYGAKGLVRHAESRVIVTDAGMPLLDALLGELVPAALVEA